MTEMTQLDNRKEPSQGPVGGSEAQEREAFEADAAPMGFDLTRQSVAVPEPWSEYADADTGHRWGGWLAARATAAAPAAPVRVDGMALSSWANKDMSVLIAHLREDTNFDAALVEQMLQFAINAAHPPAAVGQALEAKDAKRYRQLREMFALNKLGSELHRILRDVRTTAGEVDRAVDAAMRAADTKTEGGQHG